MFLKNTKNILKQDVCATVFPIRGTVTIAETYANSLEQIFWSISAIANHIIIRADASNVFAEAPAPKAPLYVYLDK